MRSAHRYEDFVDEQRKGLVHGVFIDDTGSPGLQDTPTNLHPKRKSWVAVIVPRPAVAETWDQLPNAVDELKSLTGATEFHFADIYAGRREFKGFHCQCAWESLGSWLTSFLNMASPYYFRPWTRGAWHTSVHDHPFPSGLALSTSARLKIRLFFS